MIFLIAKLLELAGLMALGAAFFVSFPDRMDYRIFAASGLLFISGWIIERYLLKK